MISSVVGGKEGLEEEHEKESPVGFGEPDEATLFYVQAKGTMFYFTQWTP